MSNDPFSQEIGSDDRPRCEEAMGGVIALTRSERASKHSSDSPLLGGNTPGSDEERIKQDDLTDFVPPTPYDSPLSGGHTPRSDEDCLRFGDQQVEKESQKIGKEAKGKRKSLDEEYVSKQGRKSDKTKPMFNDSDFAELDVDNAMENVKGDAKIQGRNTAEQITTNRDTVNTASINVSTAGPSNVSTADTADPSTSIARDIFNDEMMTIADTLVAIRSTRPRTTSVVIRDVEEEPRRATPVPTLQSQDSGKGKMVEPESTSKNPIKAQVQRDAEIAQRLHEEEKVKLKRLFEPDNDDILEKLQIYMHDPLVWRLYDTCGVHHVSLVRGLDIFMLVKKEYPLTRGTLGLMMVARLLVEADSEMSKELLRKIFYQVNRSRGGQGTRPNQCTPGSDEERLEQDDLMDFVPPTPYDSPLSGGYTPGSDEGRPNINELMAICTNLSNRVLALEQSKTAQDLVIQKLKKKVKRLEKKQRARTPGMKLFKIGTSKRKSLDKENVSKQGRKSDKTKPIVAGPLNVSTADTSTSTAGDIFEDEMVTIADTLVAIRSTRPRTTSVVIHDVEEEPRRATPVPTVQSQDKGKGKMVEPEPTPKNPIRTQIQRDAEIAQRLFEEEQAQFEREQRIAREKAAKQEAKDAVLIEQMEDIQARIDADELLVERLQQEEREQFTIEEKSRLLVEMIAERKRFFAAQRAEQIRNKPPTRTQLRNKMITYLKNMGRFTHNQLKNRSLEEIQMLYEKEQKWIDDFVPMDSELEVQRLKIVGQEVLVKPVKRQKIGEASGSGEDQSAEKEKELSEEELQKLLVVVPVEEVYVEALQVKYPIIDWDVYSEDTRRYWKIIRVGNHREAYQIFAKMLKKFDRDNLVKLWDLVKERFSTTEPTNDKEKELWVELKRLFEPDNDDILWKLQRYMHDPLKDYPLSKGVLMLVNKLLVEQSSEMANELLRKIFIQANRPR
ncbi:hypothetical protein Tco_1370819 [Tanacetum coccineum]